MRNVSEDRVRARVTTLGFVVLLLLAVLVSRLWFLQVLSGTKYTSAATANHVRLVTVAAPRGKILDRNGFVLVNNRSSLIVGIRRDDLRNPTVVLPRVAKLLGITMADVNKRMADKRISPYKAVTIAEEVPQEKVLYLREHADQFPGVETSEAPVRQYPLGSIGSHVLGYVSEIGPKELDKMRDKGYRLGDEIGRYGVERSYEDVLRGTPGLDKLEVDATGTVLRSLGHQDYKPGEDLQLSIDAQVQKVTEESLALGIERARAQTFKPTGEHFKAPAGGVVVLDAKTGEVVAMASYPTFDLRKFVGGIDPTYWSFVNNPDNNQPLLNRAMQASYPPGSTFKAFMAAAALSTGMATPNGGYPCTSEFSFGNPATIFHNWKPRNATLSLAEALVESCDTVFYKFGANWWLKERRVERANKPVFEAAGEWAKKFGLGRPTKIDLASEAKGRIPGRDFQKRLWEKNRDKWCTKAKKTKEAGWADLCNGGFVWRGGDAVNMVIGQGEVEATPLQMAVGYAALANGGTVPTPHVGLRAVDPVTGKSLREIAPAPSGNVGLDPRWGTYIRDALAQVAQRGTAAGPFSGWNFSKVSVAAKTGSAEIGGKQPFSWFASFAPANNPKYVVVSVVEQAGFGSQVSGPICRRIMDKLFGFPLSPIVYGTRSD